MSYSPARIEDNAKPEVADIEKDGQDKLDAPEPGWFAVGNDTDVSDHLVQRYRDRIAKQEAQRKTENDVMETHRRNLDARFKAAKAQYDRPGNDNPPEVKLQTRRTTLPLSEIKDAASVIPAMPLDFLSNLKTIAKIKPGALI